MIEKPFIILSHLERNRQSKAKYFQIPIPLDIPQQKQEIGFENRKKPQISTIAGISPKESDRYRVTSGDEILGDRLSLEEALQVAKGGQDE